jgi:predicted TIM-barrel fold metal-dependent hydrolase
MKKIAVEEHVNERDMSLFPERLKDMDGAGIDMQVLSYAFHYDENLSAREVQAMARKTNEDLARVTEKYPERFAAFAVLALQDPDKAADELERAVKKLGLKGTMLFGMIKGYLDDPKYWPLFEMAEKLDVPIYIHGISPQGEAAKPYLTYPGLVGAMLGMAAETSLHAMRLIMGGVFDKYPRLKIILGHMGEGIPFWSWRIDSRWWEERQRDPKSEAFYKHFRKTPSQHFKDNFYVTTSGMFWHPALQVAIAAMEADRVLFAVDYPPESITDGARFIETAPLSDSDKEKICHLNAERLLKL